MNSHNDQHITPYCSSGYHHARNHRGGKYDGHVYIQRQWSPHSTECPHRDSPKSPPKMHRQKPDQNAPHDVLETRKFLVTVLVTLFGHTLARVMQRQQVTKQYKLSFGHSFGHTFWSHVWSCMFWSHFWSHFLVTIWGTQWGSLLGQLSANHKSLATLIAVLGGNCVSPKPFFSVSKFAILTHVCLHSEDMPTIMPSVIECC